MDQTQGYAGLDTLQLLERAQGGDRGALDRLVERCRPRLQRWARGRLPRFARGAIDTDDLVQETLFRALRRVNDFVPQREGSLHVYLRKIVLNKVHDEVCRVRHGKRAIGAIAADDPTQTSPLEEAIGQETLERYEAAFDKLSQKERELIVMRSELRYGYKKIAEATGKPSPDAARMAVGRALLRLATEMRRGR